MSTGKEMNVQEGHPSNPDVPAADNPLNPAPANLSGPPGYYPNPPGYSPNPPGYSPNPLGYSPNPPGYPFNAQGYSSNTKHYPPNQPGNPCSPPGFPPNPQAYPPNPQGYPPNAHGYPLNPPYQPQPGIVVTTQSSVVVLPQPAYQDYLAWSILNLIFCNLILGIVAVVFSSKTRHAARCRDCTSAASYSRTAFGLNITALVLGIATNIIWIALTVTRRSDSYYYSYQNYG